MNKFQVAVQFLVDPRDGFDAEGGYVSDPTDSGGETKYGISKAQYPDEDIKNLTLERAMELYHQDYWVQFNIEQYDSPYCIAVLDSYVQHNSKKVAVMLETAKGDLRALLEARRNYYLAIIQRRPDQVKYKKGWFYRINQLSKYCDIAGQ